LIKNVISENLEIGKIMFQLYNVNNKTIKEINHKLMTIWVNEQIDPCGILYSCIACCDEKAAEDCHQTWLNNLTEDQKKKDGLLF
jgi:hypothetical protein